MDYHRTSTTKPTGKTPQPWVISRGISAVKSDTPHGLADNTVGRIIESLLRVDLIILDELGFAPLDDTGTQLLFRLVAGAYERRSLAIGSHWPFEQWGRFLPEQTTAVSILDRLLHHATVVITDGDSYRMKDAQHRKGNPQPT